MAQNLIAATTMNPKVLYSGQLAAITDQTLYTVAAGSAAVIKHGTICNTSGSAVTINKVSVIPSGGSSDGTHHVIASYSLAANDTLPLADYLDGCCLGPGDSIHVQVGTANVIDVVITGLESS